MVQIQIKYSGITSYKILNTRQKITLSKNTRGKWWSRFIPTSIIHKSIKDFNRLTNAGKFAYIYVKEFSSCNCTNSNSYSTEIIIMLHPVTLSFWFP